MGRAFDDLFSTVEKGVAVEVTGVPKFESHGIDSQQAGSAQRVPASLLAKVQGVSGVRTAAGSLTGYAQLVDTKGKAITTGGAPTFGVTWSDDPQLNPLRLAGGRPPRASGEIVLASHTAASHDRGVGDRAPLLRPAPSRRASIPGMARLGA